MSTILQRMAMVPVTFDGQIVGWTKMGEGYEEPPPTVFADDMEAHAVQTQAAADARAESAEQGTTMEPSLINLNPTQAKAIASSMTYKPSAILAQGGSSSGYAPQQDITIPTPDTSTDWLLLAGGALVIGGAAWYFMKKR